jgi:hypothetical protein
MTSWLSEELLECIFHFLVETHVVALCRCRCVCKWYQRCATKEQWTTPKLKEKMKHGCLEWNFERTDSWKKDTTGAGVYLYSLQLTAGQNRDGPIHWRLLFFPLGNKDSVHMALYVEPLSPLRSDVKVNLKFYAKNTHAEDIVKETDVRFCCEDDWGFRKWQIIDEDATVICAKVDVVVHTAESRCPGCAHKACLKSLEM